MKFCRFLYCLFIVQTINSCIADTVSKTEAPAGASGKTVEPADLNETTKDYPEADSISSNTQAVNSLPAETFKDTSDEISANVGQASQIQSSFEDVPKSKPIVVDVAVNEKLPGVLNQGTLSQDLPDTGTLGVVTLVDSASADLKKLASSASAEVTTDSKYEKTSIENATAGTLPPVVILPPATVDQVNQNYQAEVKTEATTSETPNPEPPVVRAEPKVVEQPMKVDVNPESPGIGDKNAPPIAQQTTQGFAKPTEPVVPHSPQPRSTLDTVPVPSPEIPQEEIPSFSQNKTTHSPPSRGPAPSKMRSKNYASPDCGAKIVATNPEAENPSGVLANSKDEYLINKCSTQRMWLIIELCEAVQAKKIELANFELFSSSPKDFSVYLSHNFPSRDWTSVGQFTAKDERTVQSFNLQPHLFGKFLKVEFNSHYGKEHFCCTSLIRVYGTSEFEVLETENEGHGAAHELDDDDDDVDEAEQPIGADTGKPAKNLFGHATDAVYTIVRKAAEVLVKSGDSQNQSQTLDQKNTTALIPSFHVRPRHCSTLRHLIVCNNCSPEFFDQVYHLLSCQADDMQALIESPFVLDTINNSQLCSLSGLDYIAKRYLAAPLQLQSEDQLDQAGYLAAMLPAEYIAALCNILAVLEGKVVLNTSQTAMAQQGVSIIGKPVDSLKNLLIEHKAPQTCSMDASFTSSHCQSGGGSGSFPHSSDVSTSFPGSQPVPSSSSIASEIKPTRTLSKEEVKEISVQEAAAPHSSVQKSSISPDVLATIQSPTNVKIEPSMILVNMPGGPAEKAKSSSVVPEVPNDSETPEQSVLEAPPLDREKDLGEASFNIDSGISEDQEPSKDLDALFLEMKALVNNEETSSEVGSATTPSSVITQTRVPAQQAQKESVFLRLSNKIKALERNMSLSGQYLEELSRRYKKQEELSRALNKTLVLLREEIRKSKDREQQRDSDILFLRTQLIQLTATVEAYQSEKDSWQHKAVVFSQHFALIVIEVVMFGIVIWMCRRLPNEPGNVSSGGPQRKWSTGWRKVNKSNAKHLRRRSSLDGLGSSSDVKKRRPSEEALQISGSYKDLLLQDENVVVVEGEDISHEGSDQNWLAVSGPRDQRRRRKRRKEGLVKSSSSNNLSQLQANNSQTITRKISAPMHSYSLPSGGVELENSEGQSTMREAHLSSNSPTNLKTGNICLSEAAFTPVSPSPENFTLYQAVQIHPGFSETATSARNRRSSNLPEANLPFNSSISPDWMNHHDGDSGSSLSGQSSRSKGLDSLEPVCNSSQSDSPGILMDDKKKKLGKKGGLKSMVKKFF
ncbi:SUN domain-containing ossification factor [Frankliniella fusca]|uniref:SUN domain-containing ossification factor n=1 Tax=Frankliniella fusca TaxID=407009 RepID=A0AAE1HTB4_9NEOP|nr:SUN domain-containing ossification factor [Frankliniella fusca]